KLDETAKAKEAAREASTSSESSAESLAAVDERAKEIAAKLAQAKSAAAEAQKVIDEPENPRGPYGSKSFDEADEQVRRKKEPRMRAPTRKNRRKKRLGYARRSAMSRFVTLMSSLPMRQQLWGKSASCERRSWRSNPPTLMSGMRGARIWPSKKNAPQRRS